MILVDLEGVQASRPGKPLFDDLSLTLRTGDRLGVVGLNGSGKSTLLRVMAGASPPEAGTVRRGRGVRTAVLEQRPVLPEGTVRGAVGDGWEAAAMLDHLGMTCLLDVDVATLSGGQAKRVALARVLLVEADLLVLDEPTNHLDLESIAWLEERLARHRGGLVLVTHDRHVLDRVTTRVLEIDRGATYTYDGGYADYLQGRAEREERAAKAEATRRNLARAELAWLRRGAPARSRKPKARIAGATAIVEGRAEAPARPGTPPDLAGFGVPRLGDRVVELDDVGHSYDDGAWLFRHVDLVLDRRERLGVVGPNGAGKSTLLDLISGRITPVEGTVRRGATVRVGTYDQSGVELDPALTVRQAVAGPARAPDWEDDRLLERFWFGADARHAPIGLLSGGERRRLQLLVVLAAGPNVLLLDEPTNDLDLDTLRVLEDFLEDWPGALVVVSHDRALLERTVDDVLAFDTDDDGDGDGAGGRGGGRRVAPVPGGFAAWEARQRGRHPQTPPPRVPAGTRPERAPAGPSASTVRHRLMAAERRIQALERRRHELEAELAAASGDHVALARVGTELAEVQAALGAAEDEWLSLAP